MDLFYLIVSGIAVVVLIIVLAIIGVGMRNRGNAGAWPPIESTCPDYWTIDPEDKISCMIPTNTSRNTGTIYSGSALSSSFLSDPNTTLGLNSSNTSINFTNAQYATCKKQLWAKKWGIYWDGYSNYNGCDITTSTPTRGLTTR
jgi:hypothetical protein